MQARNWIRAAAGALALLAATTVFAADSDRAVFVYAQGGGISSTKNFDPLRDSSFKTGYDLGGGAGIQINRYVAVRGNFVWAHSRGDDLDLDVPSFDSAVFRRYIYGGDVQLGYPLRLGFTPYLFAGGGAMTVSNRTDRSYSNFTRGFGRGGVGLNYDIPETRVGVFVQGAGLLYKLTPFDPDRTLFDISWTGGLRVRFPL